MESRSELLGVSEPSNRVPAFFHRCWEMLRSWRWSFLLRMGMPWSFFLFYGHSLTSGMTRYDMIILELEFRKCPDVYWLYDNMITTPWWIMPPDVFLDNPQRMGTTHGNRTMKISWNIGKGWKRNIVILEWMCWFPKMECPQVTKGFKTKSWSNDLDDFLGGYSHFRKPPYTATAYLRWRSCERYVLVSSVENRKIPHWSLTKRRHTDKHSIFPCWVSTSSTSSTSNYILQWSGDRPSNFQRFYMSHFNSYNGPFW